MFQFLRLRFREPDTTIGNSLIVTRMRAPKLPSYVAITQVSGGTNPIKVV